MDANEIASYLATHEVESFYDWEIAPEGTNSWRNCSQISVLRLIPFGLPAIPSHLNFSSQQLEWLTSVLPARNPVDLHTNNEEGFTVTDSAPSQPISDPVSENKISKPPVLTERRQEARSEKKLQVVLISAKNAFRTLSKNISTGGIYLEHDVPIEFLEMECTVFITDPESTKKIRANGTLQKDPQGIRRVVFSQISKEDQETLKSWIALTPEPRNTTPKAA